MSTTDFHLTVVGAAGKMGTRITNNLTAKGYSPSLCEKGDAALRRLHERGQDAANPRDAIPRSDLVVLAVPDTLIGAVSKELVPLMRPGATLMLLDPAAAYINEVELRDDCTFVVTHPCHPGMFMKQDSLEALEDRFGGITARQDIVIALLQGEEEDFEKARRAALDMFAPVNECHRITVEQMAVLEPATSEVVTLTAVQLIKDGVDEAVKHGVPEAAARAFILGHVNVLMAIVFGETDFPVSDAAKVAVDLGYREIIKRDWRKVFEPGYIRETVMKMVHPGR